MELHAQKAKEKREHKHTMHGEPGKGGLAVLSIGRCSCSSSYGYRAGAMAGPKDSSNFCIQGCVASAPAGWRWLWRMPFSPSCSAVTPAVAICWCWCCWAGRERGRGAGGSFNRGWPMALPWQGWGMWRHACTVLACRAFGGGRAERTGGGRGPQARRRDTNPCRFARRPRLLAVRAHPGHLS
jgi:hypothetical protein